MLKIAILAQRIFPALWLGMLCAIAIDAQLKFQAPGITRELGLGIGKLVFTEINRIEWILAPVVGVAVLPFTGKLPRIIYSFVALILLIQTFWLLPALIGRIDAIAAGHPPPQSSLHLTYVIFELAKMLLLLALSISLNWPAKTQNERH